MSNMNQKGVNTSSIPKSTYVNDHYKTGTRACHFDLNKGDESVEKEKYFSKSLRSL